MDVSCRDDALREDPSFRLQVLQVRGRERHLAALAGSGGARPLRCGLRMRLLLRHHALGIKRYFFGPLLRAGKVILLLPKVILLPPKVVQKAPRGPF